MNQKIERSLYHDDFNASADAWRSRQAEMGPPHASKTLIAVGSVAVAFLGIASVRQIRNEPVPASYINPTPIHREFTPTPESEPTQLPCFVDTYSIDEVGGSRWSIAEENYPDELPMDVIRRMRDITAEQDGRDPTNPWVGDTIEVKSPGCE